MDEKAGGERMLSARQVAELAGVSGQRVRSLLFDGRFPGAVLVDTPIGVSYWQVPESSVMAWIADEKRRRFGHQKKAAAAE